jgi:hypothetical protein
MLGLHVMELSNPLMLVDFLRIVFIANIFYTLCIANIKFVVLAFYWRLFSVQSRIMIWVVAGMCLSWFIAIVSVLTWICTSKTYSLPLKMFCVIFSCIPVQAAWDITITDAKCIPLRSIYLGGSIPNVILDIVIVFMPMPYVWRLHAPLGQRLILAGMFVLGTFIAVVSLVRLIIFLQIPIATSGDATYNFREIIVWSIVEVNIGLVCACLPSLKPAFALIGLSGLFSFSSSRASNNQSKEPIGSYPQYGRSTDSQSRPRKKGSTGGLFSTIGGLSRLDSEEELKIVDDSHGKNHSEVEMMPIGHHDRDNASTTHSNQGINVQTQWSVLVNNKNSI